MKKIAFFMFLWVGITATAQTAIKTMFYNLMHYPTTYVYDPVSNTYIDRSNILKLIVDEVQPDIFMVCELEDATGANAILNTVLNVTTTKYAAPTFTLNQSSGFTSLNQYAYYNTDKLELTNQSILQTNIRDINWYTFILNTVDKLTNPIYLEVFVTHLKASTGAANVSKRLDMITQFTNNLATIPSNHHVLFAGDFNFYTNSETGYQKLIDPANAIVMKDPLQREGSWHNNSSFQDVFTQSPLTSNTHFNSSYGTNGPGSDGVFGGIDDRFDFIMLDEGTINSTELYYKPNTYNAFGNNGNCFNNNVNDIACTGVFSQTTRDRLFNMSDHLPVVLELEYAGNLLSVEEHHLVSHIRLIGANLVQNALLVQSNSNLNNQTASIYNSYGQKVHHFSFESTLEIITIDVSNLSSGMYYIKLDNFVNSKPLKFIKAN